MNNSHWSWLNEILKINNSVPHFERMWYFCCHHCCRFSCCCHFLCCCCCYCFYSYLILCLCFCWCSCCCCYCFFFLFVISVVQTFLLKFWEQLSLVILLHLFLGLLQISPNMWLFLFILPLVPVMLLVMCGVYNLEHWYFLGW